MKIPLDYICVKSGILCPRCQFLVDSGQVKEFEVEVMRALIELEESSVKFLKDAEYHKSYREDNILVVVLSFKKKIPPHELGKLSRALSNKLNIRVKVVPKSKDVRQLATLVLHPARILGINTVWLPDGSTHYVIRVPRSDFRIISHTREVYEKILSEIIGQEVEIRVAEI